MKKQIFVLDMVGFNEIVERNTWLMILNTQLLASKECEKNLPAGTVTQ